MVKKFGLVFILLFCLVAVFSLVACQKPEPKASPASIVNGGLIYDKWWKTVAGAAEPKDNQSLWALQATNTRKGPDTWRCKECHGWDYKGKSGAYGKGSHTTGFAGVYDASLSKTKAQLLDALKGKADSRHNFASLLGEAGLNDVANFIKEGLIDTTKYIDSTTKKAIGADATNGKGLYTSNCVACHGADGKQILFDGTNSLGFLANDNPWEVLHKIRVGQPGVTMPSGVPNGWTVQQTADILGYAQTLPTK